MVMSNNLGDHGEAEVDLRLDNRMFVVDLDDDAWRVAEKLPGGAARGPSHGPYSRNPAYNPNPSTQIGVSPD
jgi:hypothetical protein